MINTLDLNIEDSRQVDASHQLTNENNFSQSDTTTRSTFINSHDLNIEDSKVNMVNLSHQINNDTTVNPHERNIESINNTALINATNDYIRVNESSDTINKFELNIDTKSESLLSNTTQTSSKSYQFDLLDVNKVMSIVKPFDTNLLNSKSLPQKKAKREASVLDLTNTNDTKRFKSDQSIAFNNSTNSSNSKINNSCHITSHAGEKEYSCETCGKTFSKPYNLKTHERIHTGEKKYSCETCDQKFSTSSDLKKHERTHTGEKPYSCDSCDQAFSQLSNLKTHKKRTHK